MKPTNSITVKLPPDPRFRMERVEHALTCAIMGLAKMRSKFSIAVLKKSLSILYPPDHPNRPGP